MRERRKIVEVESRQPLMERLLMAQCFDTIFAPAGIKFTFGGSVSRSEAHQCGAQESADEAEADKDQQAAKPEAKQLRGSFGLAHSCPRRKGFVSSPPD